MSKRKRVDLDVVAEDDGDLTTTMAQVAFEAGLPVLADVGAEPVLACYLVARTVEDAEMWAAHLGAGLVDDDDPVWVTALQPADGLDELPGVDRLQYWITVAAG